MAEFLIFFRSVSGDQFQLMSRGGYIREISILLQFIWYSLHPVRNFFT